MPNKNKTEVQLWFYKAEGGFYDKLIRLIDRTKYSHVEMYIDGYCYSSSPRDGGVRRKIIHDMSNWDVVHISVTDTQKQHILNVFSKEYGKKYDWLGAIKTTIPFFPNHKDRWFCSEIIAYALGLDFPRKWTPAMLYDLFKEKINYDK